MLSCLPEMEKFWSVLLSMLAVLKNNAQKSPRAMEQ